MGFMEKLKDITVKPYKAFENKFIPIINSINNYLDRWFPQEKWNWRKIAVFWACMQAFIIGILQIFVIIKYNERVEIIYKQANESPYESWKQEVAIADPLTVYQVIFLVAQFFQFFLICDTVTKSSTIQLIIGTIFSICISFYSIIQYIQQDPEKISYKEHLSSLVDDNGKTIDLHPSKNIEITIIVLMFIFCVGWIVVTLRLYKVFGWNVFKQLGADIGVRNRLKLYQILISLLKIDIFLFTSFTMQFVVFVVYYIQNEYMKMRIINIVLLVIVFLMPFIGFWATKKEDYRIMFVFIIFLSISIGYMVYSIVDIIMDKQKSRDEGCVSNGLNSEICMKSRYRNCEKSLSFASASTALVGLATFILALVNFKNFPKGLKKDKSIRPQTSSNNSTLSHTLNSQQRWSIE